jgi:hypothetical protein
VINSYLALAVACPDYFTRSAPKPTMNSSVDTALPTKELPLLKRGSNTAHSYHQGRNDPEGSDKTGLAGDHSD